MKIEITKVVILKVKDGADLVFLHTNLPNGIYPFNGTQTLQTEIARGKAEEWVKMNLEIKPEIING